jgi:hypothetical protein
VDEKCLFFSTAFRVKNVHVEVDRYSVGVQKRTKAPFLGDDISNY